jgi:OPA family glycerol-3-phosphate transporter-like MFS transporter
MLGVFVLLLGIVLPKGAGNSGTASASKSGSQNREENYFALIAKAGIIPIFGCIIMMGFLRDGIESWLPTLYSEAFSRSSEESVLVSVILPLFSILSISIITVLRKTRLFSNEIRGSAILFLASLAFCIPTVLMIKLEATVFRFICLLLSGLVCACMHGCNFLLISCLPGRFASHGRAATTSGFCNACTYVGAAISNYGIGVIAENLGWTATVISWIIVSALGILLAVFAFRKYSGFIKSEN